MRSTLIFILNLLVLITLDSCGKKELISNYERPDWLRGNVFEILHEKGNYTIFLEGIEKSGLKEVLDGKTITTVFAPNDVAFSTYLKEKNIASIAQMPIQDLKRLIGYHLIYYAYGKDRLQNYQPEGSEGYEPNFAGLYYKHRSRSSDSITVEVDLTDGRTKKVFHKDRFLPVFSQQHFTTKGIDATANYEYFYGTGIWRGNQGFNISNAGVDEYAIPADNGYVYLLDRVIEPLNTVYQELAKKNTYSDFIAIYDKFKSFWYDEPTSLNYAAAGDSLFIVNHGPLPPIASEWSYNGGGGFPDYANLGQLAYRANNVFAPSNTAIQNFYQEYFSPYYNSIKDVDLLPLALVMYNHVYLGNVVFPSEIGKNPDIKTSFGTPIVFNPTVDVQDKAMASNGVYYGLNKVLVPDMFNSVTGPAFRNPKYKMFMYMLANTGLYQLLSSQNIDFTLFIPSDETLKGTIVGESYLFWSEGNPLVYGDENVLVENENGILVPLSVRQQEILISESMVYGKIDNLSGTKVLRTRNPYSYVYVTGGKLHSSATYNTPDLNLTISRINGDWYNGNSYETSLALQADARMIKSTITGAQTISNPLNQYAEFSKLLARVGHLEVGRTLPFLFGNRFILFAPDNQTVLNGIASGDIPSNNTELAEYLKSYFVSVPDNSLSDYPFPGFGIQGVWNTTKLTGYNLFRKLELLDRTTHLELKDIDGTLIPISNELPKLFSDGAVYKISRLLKK
ncbi:fasciclin domain-containing protein [Sphingobacterium bovistauri]|uniref:Fasciclin domain-containing protein n=1 Tax=Sphingobacterium bovistauri TaxID=2781959 RepID=A0ABS7Z108_9SPHI|nr:fasciclin domain-containing protein [Sphingobacterium bovistauri]MCA5003863.1 fasciclin domain-containing protein [Sphingobacterium bovistauri]